MAKPKSQCLVCGNEVTGCGDCPGCGTNLVRCDERGCLSYVPAEAAFCPRCGAACRKRIDGDVQTVRDAIDTEGTLDLGGAFDVPDGVTLATRSASGGEEYPDDPVDGQSLTKSPVFGELLEFLQDSKEALHRELNGALSEESFIRVAPGDLPTPPAVGRKESFSDVPLSVEVLQPDSYRVGHQGILRLKISAGWMSEERDVQVAFESSLLEEGRVFSVRLRSRESHEFPPLRFVPDVAGMYELELTVTVTSVDGVPQGRWVGCETLRAVREETDTLGSIQASGDVIIMGRPVHRELASDTGGAQQGWSTFRLRPDSQFQRRLAASCPAGVQGIPTYSQQTASSRLRFEGVLICYDQQSSEGAATCVICGSQASAGRGGLDSVSWWIAPTPYDEHQHSRLSRQHVSFELRNARAWATNSSVNGLALNGDDVPKNDSMLLADADEIDLARVASVRVRLFAVDSRVYAVRLDRCDALRDRVGYMLTTGSLPRQPQTARRGWSRLDTLAAGHDRCRIVRF